MILRAYRPVDADALAQIFYDAVHIGAAPFYSADQLAAWAPLRPSAKTWAARLRGLTTWVALAPQPVGFMSLRADGYLDLAFVAPDQQGRGAATALHTAVLAHARTQNMQQLHVEASLAAHGFFLRRGWQDLGRQTIERHGQQIDNFRMQWIFQ
ncbi:MAG: GNAT family N-acetyltransferase [Cypionkella sp.]